MLTVVIFLSILLLLLLGQVAALEEKVGIYKTLAPMSEDEMAWLIESKQHNAYLVAEKREAETQVSRRVSWFKGNLGLRFPHRSSFLVDSRTLQNTPIESSPHCQPAFSTSLPSCHRPSTLR